MFKFIRNSGKKLLNSRGIVQLPIIIGLMLMAVALPMVANLVQKNTDNRGHAISPTCQNGSFACNILGQLVSCSNGAQVFTNCQSGYHCDATAKSCVFNNADCADNKTYRVNNGKYKCSSVNNGYNVAYCDNGALTGAKYCGDFVKCNESSGCEVAAVTTTTNCGSHNNGDKFCDGSLVKICSSGTITRVQDCATSSKSCSNGACVGGSTNTNTATTPKAVASTPTCDSSGGSCYTKSGNGNTCEEINSSDFDFKTINVGCGSGNICCSKTAKAAPAPVVDNNKYYCSTNNVGKNECTASTGDWAEVDNKADNVLKKTWGSDAIADCKSTCAAATLPSTCKTSCDAGSGLVHSAVANPNSLGGNTANSACSASGLQDNASCKNINSGVAGCNDAYNCCACVAKVVNAGKPTVKWNKDYNGGPLATSVSLTATCTNCDHAALFVDGVNTGNFVADSTKTGNVSSAWNYVFDYTFPSDWKDLSSHLFIIKACSVDSSSTGNICPTANADQSPEMRIEIHNNNTSSTCTKKSLGDANCDGKVDENDYNIWIREIQKTDTTVTADFNSDGAVDGTDFSIWNKNLEK